MNIIVDSIKKDIRNFYLIESIKKLNIGLILFIKVI